ncbi:MAG: O-antigen ligase family protein [Labilithrix sp.]|nr:O-antigen ligase family protein [Labilithrix sp.]MCW5812143.1 O-antigen ligase family protein [Labilithrix sp.]
MLDDTATLDERILGDKEEKEEDPAPEGTRHGTSFKSASTVAREAEFADLHDRVQKHYGAFGEKPQRVEIDDRVVFADNGWKTTTSVIGGVFLASAFLWFASHPRFASPGAWANSFRLDSAFAVVWMPLLAWAMARLPLQKSLRIYLALALFIEPFSEVMFRELGEGGYWNSVMWPSAVAYFGTLKELAGVPGASFSTFLVVTGFLLHRAISTKKVGYTEPPAFAKGALLVFLSSVVTLAVYGLLRGGQTDWTFRQTIHMLQLPIVGLLFLYALRVPEDLAAVGTAYVVAALARSALVVFVYFGVCMPQGITAMPGKPEWCTNHSDTVLFVSALVILFAHALEQRRRHVTLRALGLGAFILFAIVLNNRRLAFVSLAIAPFLIYLALDPSKRKRRVTAALLLAAPVLAGYVLVGSEVSSSSAVFKPAKSIVSVLDQKDASSLSRDIENENLIYTLQESPVVMRGFGHEYDYSPANPPVDLTDTFKNYRLIAHNGVLWLWSIAGVLGFTLIWMIYPLAGTMAMRGYRSAETPLERSAALAALGMVAVCVIQIWGDQGLNSYMTLITFGVAFAVASRLAVRAA